MGEDRVLSQHKDLFREEKDVRICSAPPGLMVWLLSDSADGEGPGGPYPALAIATEICRFSGPVQVNHYRNDDQEHLFPYPVLDNVEWGLTENSSVWFLVAKPHDEACEGVWEPMRYVCFTEKDAIKSQKENDKEWDKNHNKK